MIRTEVRAKCNISALEMNFAAYRSFEGRALSAKEPSSHTTGDDNDFS